VRGVALASGEIVGGDAVVIAMGPWSILAARWLPLPAVFGYKGHSLVFETGGAIPAEALFLEYREASGEILTPELFPRADGTTRVCAISSTGRCRSILPMLRRLMRVRTRGSKRCVGISRQC
jgi:glycine/D-amino acid oxidase-like deaminating enzyme